MVAWKRLSAEESSKVLVQAIVQGDLALLETVMASPDDLQALGVPAAGVEQAAKAATHRRGAFTALLKTGLKGWDSSVVWSRFDGTMPHVIPNDPALKLPADLILYENPIVFGGYKDPAQDPSKLAYLQATEVVKVGEVWKFVELPACDRSEESAPAARAGGRNPLLDLPERRRRAGAGRPAARSPRRARQLRQGERPRPPPRRIGTSPSITSAVSRSSARSSPPRRRRMID